VVRQAGSRGEKKLFFLLHLETIWFIMRLIELVNGSRIRKFEGLPDDPRKSWSNPHVIAEVEIAMFTGFGQPMEFFS